MSRMLGGLVPVALAVGFGVLNGYVTFAPEFKKQDEKKMQEREAAEANLLPDMVAINPDKNKGDSSRTAKNATKQNEAAI